MNAQGLFSIGGIASGLDTNDIVNQLMRLERQPVVRLEARNQDLQTTKDAWGQITARLSALRTATDKLRRPEGFGALVSVTSSDTDAVAVRRNGGAIDDGQLSFTVESLAREMKRSSTDLFAGRDAELDGRSLTIDTADASYTSQLDTDATLDDLMADINAAGIGVRASALQVNPGEYQLVLTAESAGTDASFTATGTGWDTGLEITQGASNAVLDVAGITVTRASNTIDDLFDGVTLDLKRTADVPVTVSANRDVDGAVNAVKGLVGAANAALGTIRDLTDYDPETKKAGPLQGQFAATQLAFSLRSALTSPVQGLSGVAALSSAVGISADRDGVIELDEAALRAAFTEDFEGTSARFARTGASSDTELATSVSGGRGTQAGTYDVAISRAADIARMTGATSFPSGAGEPKTFMVRAPNGTIVSVTMDSREETVATATQKIQAALDEADVRDIAASYSGDATNGNLVLESTGYGSNVSFEVWEVDAEGDVIEGGTVFGLEGTHTGVDVEGTIGGIAATGNGRLLSASEGPAAGMHISTVGGIDIPDGTTADFEVSFWHGTAGALDGLLARAEGTGGSIARARASLDSQMNLFRGQIEAFEERLESREATIRRQFVGLEVAMDRFKSQGEWLTGQLEQLTALNTQSARRR